MYLFLCYFVSVRDEVCGRVLMTDLSLHIRAFTIHTEGRAVKGGVFCSRHKGPLNKYKNPNRSP